MSTIHIAGISGSLRRASFNTALLRAAQTVLPDNTKLEIVDYSDVPLYNHDLETEVGFPEAVADMRQQLRLADGILFATPEYNWSIPGVMKNAIDWASRGPDSPIRNKPAAIMGAGGRLGTAYAQMHLRQVLMHNHLRVVTNPSVFVARASEHFDAEGGLRNDRYLNQIQRLLAALVAEVELVDGVTG